MGAVRWEVEAVPSDQELLGQFLRTREVKDRAALIARHIPLVETLARSFLGKGHREPQEDLVQVGMVGLIKAVDHFDPAREVQFTTYATHHVIGEIRHYLRDKSNLIRHPRWLGFLTYQVNAEAERLAQKLGRLPSAVEIAQSMNITEEGVLEIMRLNEHLSSATLDEETTEVGFELIQRKIRAQRLISFQLPIEDKIVLLNAFEKLMELEQKAIYLFFYYDLTQGEIGKRLGISQRTVSRVIQKGLSKMKAVLVTDLW